MDRRTVSTQLTQIIDWRRSLNAASNVLATTDGRWALVSTSMTALVAGAMVWLAAGASPPVHPRTQEASTSFLPYTLFSQLVQAGGRMSSASLFPTGTARAQTPPPSQLDGALAAEDAGDNGNPGTETRTLTLESGDTLAGVLEDAGVPSADANAALLALAKVYNLRSARAGQSFQVTFQSPPETQIFPPDTTPGVINIPLADEDDADANGVVTPVASAPAGRLLSITFSPSVEHDITIARAADGGFNATDAVKQLVQHQHRAGATIDSSLYLAATQAGIPTDVVVEMIHMFSYKVDFQRDLRPGDLFQVDYDYYYTPEGMPAKQGNIAYAEIHTGGRVIALYRYQPDPNQPADYFDTHGVSVKGMLMKTPVDGARITSGFGMRFHPILGYTRMHKGVDFGVPIGTPVMAAGSGTIAVMGVEHGYGNFVLINHGNNYSTAYGHLSRFVAGLHRGSHVNQGQVFAYSGMSGMATGPHLHYEIRINNVQVNPTTVKIAQGRTLQGRDLREFLVSRLRTDAVLASTPLETKVADVATDLRQAKAR